MTSFSKKINNIQKTGLIGTVVIILALIAEYDPTITYLERFERSGGIETPTELLMYISFALVVGVLVIYLFKDDKNKVK